MCTRTHIHTTALFFLWLSAARTAYPTLKVAPSACFPLLPNVICETSSSQGQRQAFSFKSDLTTSKLSSDSRRKGAWGGSTVQWQGRRKIPPPAFMLRVKIDVQWVYENISLFCLCALGGWNIPLCSCHPEDWMFRHHIWITPKQLPYHVWKMINDFVFCHYLQKNMWLSCVEHKIRKKSAMYYFNFKW